MSVDEAPASLSRAVEWVYQGEEVNLMRGDLCVARLLPALPQTVQNAEAPAWPDFAGRLRAIYGDTVLPLEEEDTGEDRRQSALSALDRIAARGGISDIEDPAEWQRKSREEHPLPRREQ